MGGEFGTYVVEEKCILILVRITERKSPLGNMGLSGKIILTWILEK